MVFRKDLGRKARLGLALLMASAAVAQQFSEPLIDEAKAAYQQGKTAEAERILQTILERRPGELDALILMGIVLDAEQRYPDAENYYRRALKIAPASAEVLNDAGNHFLSSGDRNSAWNMYRKAVAADAQHVNANLQLAQMSVEDKQGQLALSYLSHVAGNAKGEPAVLLLRARALAMCGRCEETNEILKNLASHAPFRSNDAPLHFSAGMALAECKSYGAAEESFSRALDADPQNFDILYNLGLAALRSGHTERAQKLLEIAVKERPNDADARDALAQARRERGLDLALARFHSRGPAAALQELDKTPLADRQGDYYLLRAQILDAQGKLPEAAEALNMGMRAAPTRADLYYQAAGFLLKHKMYQEALALLEQASRILPDDRELLLAQVVTLNLLRRSPEDEKLLEKIQARWPEWDRGYLLKGILLEIELKSAEARQTLEKAIALGANTPEAYYYEALAITHAAPDNLDAAQNAITHALALTSEDPSIYLLAGKISLARKKYAAAIEQLLDATRLQPSLIPAHDALRHAYSALGEVQKAQAELEIMKRIAKETGGTDDSRYAVEDFLFTVRPPG